MAKTQTAQHTPGPWTMNRHPGHPHGLAIITKDIAPGAWLAEVVAYTNGTHYANARLIAAAPDLLAALADLLAEFNQHVPEDCACPKARSAADNARAAIAKARG